MPLYRRFLPFFVNPTTNTNTDHDVQQISIDIMHPNQKRITYSKVPGVDLVDLPKVDLPKMNLG